MSPRAVQGVRQETTCATVRARQNLERPALPPRRDECARLVPRLRPILAHGGSAGSSLVDGLIARLD